MSHTSHTWSALQSLRSQSPVIHSITNYVVMNNTANALLALGASPVMAHAPEEMTEMVGIASSLVLNIGTLSKEWIRAMYLASEAARKRGIPIVLDPVGAGATSYRTATARALMQETRPAILRGNASEIIALAMDGGRTKGVDSADASHAALEAAQSLQKEFGSTVVVSGETDYILGPGKLIMVRNGHALMPRVTGLGCTASVLCGAFAAVTPDVTRAAAQGMAIMGIAGEMAAEKAQGPGSLQLHFLDALYLMNEADIASRIRIEA